MSLVIHHYKEPTNDSIDARGWAIVLRQALAHVPSKLEISDIDMYHG